ncbi:MULTISPECIES: phage tail sheath subtilisin-like domain-containing protein [unclassified Solwaraspora]|uniref:phage tail sheath family protein n=1 Tax=unclassified Solwaraspora TaxID=2627926 RepID=UPI00248B7876|nr:MULTISPECIES: phage tail sheath subtilisin-like domain-containing protein [unclassified Solwaraspora]WBB95259.1 phage tail sheath subtilisin-like domain-containing protein [Solwaraspora sp. WMMA2059]WBC20835.1 phage tail sheath subtilisin-like domain-containing protein [Solwaraspora sp. WMMA2080]WJK37032.1 phage tail sheath subtilisin-like domain-containing protein [Solwaraspora sp. WMMA2065]
MPQYLAPGVYVEEVPSAIKPIAGVGTSTAGFIGAVADDVTMPLLPGRSGVTAAGEAEPADFHSVAPAGEAQLVDGWETFKNLFGDIQQGNHTLAHAVYGFFNNGGGRCWITRVAPVDADAEPSDEDLAGALETFAAIDEIALVAIPGAVSDAVQTALLDHCENQYLQDRFAILDGRQTTTLTKEAIQGDVRDSSYGAIYYPWIDVGATDADGNKVYQPPSGHIAGVYARVDTERGVHKAPANEVIRGALGVEALVSKAQQAGLNPDDINVIRKFGGNITIWGARTLAGKEQAEWRYVPSRRLFNFLRESIDEGTQWVVFEPNAPELWSKIRRNVSAFLTTVWASGALLGNTPEQAFYVRCDETVNPAAVRDAGQLVVEIGVAMVRPAEFVVFRISQWAGGIQ